MSKSNYTTENSEREPETEAPEATDEAPTTAKLTLVHINYQGRLEPGDLKKMLEGLFEYE